MRKELLLVSGLLIGSMAFAIDPAEIDSLINLIGVVVSANKIHVNRNSVPLSISVSLPTIAWYTGNVWVALGTFMM